MELAELGVKTKEIREGRVVAEGDTNLVYRLNTWSRTSHRVLIVLGRFNKVYSLKDVYEVASSIDYTFIRPSQTFAVRSERHGVHSFTSIDIASVVGQSVIDSYKSSRKTRLKVNLDNPDVVIAADLIHDELFISVDTTGQSLHIREWRRYNHPSALKPSLSYALVLMSGWKADRLLDPFTGGATIPIEAALRWLNKPVHENREYQYRRLSFYDPVEEKKERSSHPSPIHESPRGGSIKGLEISPKHIKGALKNVKEAGVEEVVSLELADCTRWNPAEKYPYLVTNPPYGIRSGRKKYVAKLYDRFARSAKKLMEKDGILVAITTEHKQLKEALLREGFRVLSELHGRHGKLWVKAIKATL